MDKTIEQQIMDILKENRESIKSIDTRLEITENKFEEFGKKLDSLEAILKKFCEVD